MWTIALLPALLSAISIDLPERPEGASGGSVFARAITELSLDDREKRIEAAILEGNVPPFLRKLVPITVETNGKRITFEVTPDYLAVGSDEDAFLVPLSPMTAQRVAKRLDCSMPTPRMVDLIHAAASIKLDPRPIPPSAAMTTVPEFLKHNATVQEQRRDAGPLGRLVAGHKKDVVLTNRLAGRPGKVAIYGWHKRDGQPIQPLYTGHAATWVDYSHGIRLVSNHVIVDGVQKTLQEVLADPMLSPALSVEGALQNAETPIESAPGEQDEVLSYAQGIRIWINRPRVLKPCPTFLVFYALPNGNTIEQTAGKRIKPGDDWHFDIQQIAAQTRFVREKMRERNVVLVYLENDLKSWPAWRRKNGDESIPDLFQSVSSRFGSATTRLMLNGHSGGGSLILGYIKTQKAIPDQVERIAFLDSNYAYDTETHRDKLLNWLASSPEHRLSVFAYNDADALLNGKSFVSEEGGTWGRSRLMRQDFDPALRFSETHQGDLTTLKSQSGQVEFRLLDNPDHKILHTVQVERNGFIQSLLFGTKCENSDYTYWGPRAYTRFVLDK